MQTLFINHNKNLLDMAKFSINPGDEAKIIIFKEEEKTLTELKQTFNDLSDVTESNEELQTLLNEIVVAVQKEESTITPDAPGEETITPDAPGEETITPDAPGEETITPDPEQN